MRGVLASHPGETTISLLAVSVSNLENDPIVQLELPLGPRDEGRRPGAKRGAARGIADQAIDKLRDRFGWMRWDTAPVALNLTRSVPDEFRELAEKEL